MKPQVPTKIDSAVLNWVTPNADEWIAYLARQSAPKNQAKTRELLEVIQDDSEYDAVRAIAQDELDKLTRQLIQTCAREGHWSVFEQACMSLTIKTTRGLAPQILRHSLKVQEFSQRYAQVTEPILLPELRMIDGAKRNPSVVPESGDIEASFMEDLMDLLDLCRDTYEVLLESGVHPESARFYLPLATPTTLSLTGNIRDWIFYLKSRASVHAQKEHQLIARDGLQILSEQLPITFLALEGLLLPDGGLDGLNDRLTN